MTEANIKTPPFSEEAERGVLGSILLSCEGGMEKVIDKGVIAACFYDGRHLELFSQLLAMKEAGRPMDALTIGEWLKSREAIDHCGGWEYLAELQDSTVVHAHLDGYADIVLEKWHYRKLIEAGNALVQEAYVGEVKPDDIALSAMDKINGINDGSGGVLSAKELALEAGVIDQKIADGESFGLPFPWRSYQDKTYGVPRGTVTLLAGRDGKGKSKLSIYLTHYWLQRGSAMLYLPLEDSHWRLMTNLAATHGGYDGFGVKNPLRNPNYMKKHHSCLETVGKMPLAVDEAAYTVKRIGKAVSKAKKDFAKKGLVLEGVVIDGFKDIVADGGENQTSREMNVMRGLVKVAKRYDVSMICIMHLTKLEDDHWISRMHIKGSGEQNQSARMVLVYQDAGFPAGLAVPQGAIVLDCQKASVGDTGCIVLTPEMETGRFTEVENN